MILQAPAQPWLMVMCVIIMAGLVLLALAKGIIDNNRR